MRDYPEESPGRWYPGRYPGEGEDAGGYEGYRIPDPRYSDDGRLGGSGDLSRSAGSNDPLTGDLPRPDEFGRPGADEPAPFLAFGSRPGAEPVTPLPTAEPERYATQPIDRASLHRPPPGSAPGPASAGAGVMGKPQGGEPGGVVYRTRRAGTAALLLGAAIIAELLLFRVLLVAEFAAKGTPGGVLAGLLGLAGVPLVTMGLYGLMTGAASAGPTSGRPWARTPLAYLPVGLALLIAAGLAIN